MNQVLPKISIIIPCYNHGQYIEEAIKSVEKCRDKHLYEIIIINDGSTDKHTINVLQKLMEQGYQVINQLNMGLGAARNNAIKKSLGKYILPLDSDNKIRPEYIYESIKILDEQPGIAMVYGDAEYFGERSGRNTTGEFNLQKMMLENYIDACAVYRKSAWEELGGYDEKMPVMGVEDWDLWLKMAFANYSFHYINEVMYDYRVLNNSMLRGLSVDERETLFDYLQKKHNKYLHYNSLNEKLIRAGNQNKKLAFKFFLALYFPGLLHVLVKNKIIKKQEIV
ncbi:MAG: glycosyltransferase [Bacteroidota bacterium]|nr:glycosyltransferase [Bacteroidota bacterium]